MPRKRNDGGSGNVDANGVLLKHIRVELSAEQQLQFRMLAASQGLSMAAMGRKIVVEFLDSEAKQAKKK